MTEQKTATKGLRLRVTVDDHAKLLSEANTYGFDLSTLLRLRIFGKTAGLRIVHRPHADMIVLADIAGKLTGLTAELNKVGSNANQIARKLNRGEHDLFGLDSCLRLFEAIGVKIKAVIALIEQAISKPK